MNKIKITLQIESKKERHVSQLEKLFNTFTQFWKVTLSSDLPANSKFKLLQLIVVLIALTYLLCRILPLILGKL